MVLTRVKHKCLFLCHFVHTTLTCNDPKSNLVLSDEEPATNRLIRDAAFRESN